MSAETARPIQVTLTVPDETVGQDLLRCIATKTEGDAGMTIHGMKRDGSQPVTVPVGDVTPKQWEAVTLAVEKGYYHIPKECTLDALADELGISKSAVSQRLGNLERKLMTNLVDGVTD